MPGGVAEWFRQGPAKPCTPVRFRSPPRTSWPAKLLVRGHFRSTRHARQRPLMTPGNQHFAPRSRLNRVSGVRRFAVVGYIRKQRRKYRARYRDPLGRVTFDQGWDIPRSTSRLTGTAICSPSSMRPLRRRSASGLQMPAPIGARPSSTRRLAESDSRGCTLNQSCRRGSCVEGWFRSDPNKVARSHLDETQDGCASGGAVIWATEVLDQLARTGHPSRAEVTDAAMAQRAECVMLNKGPHVDAAIVVLDDILRRMSGHQRKKTPLLRSLRSWNHTT